MITIMPYGGLGNRMRSVDSAIELSKCTGKKLRVIWDANEELNASFSALFKKTELFEVEETRTAYFPRKLKEKSAVFFKKMGINYPFGTDLVLHEKDIRRLNEKNVDFCGLKKYDKIFIFINGSFMKPEKPFEAFKPSREVSTRIEKVMKGFSPRTIGIHIRRTDNAEAIKNSPLEKFSELIQKEQEEDASTSFYLSTDSPEAEEFIKEEFPGRVITYDKELSRSSEEGIKDALVDMICLSKTEKIIGSYYSSFSEVASMIGRIPLVIAGKD